MSVDLGLEQADTIFDRIAFAITKFGYYGSISAFISKLYRTMQESC
jgi:hypothetical protein